MKKNIMMRLSAVLLVAVLLTTCVISGTWAKYVSNGSSQDDARVAKWGVTVAATAAEDIFSSVYDTDKVVSQGAVDVVAPGTTGTLAGFTITGAPEVAVDVTYSAVLVLEGWTTTGTDEYCPIVINVSGEDYYIGKTGIDSVSALKTAVEAAIAGRAATRFTPSQTIEDNNLTVTWRWEFTQNTVSAQTDPLDTALGNRANAGNAATINLSVTCTVTQVD